LLWAGLVVLNTVGVAIRMQIDPKLVSHLRSSLNEDAAVGLLRRFIGTPSVTGNETAFAELLADELRSLGADEVTLVDFAPGRQNVPVCSVGNERVPARAS
jgi:hypothetical protein